MAKVSCVNKEDFVFARVAIVPCAVQKPEGGRYLGIEEKLGGQIDNAINKVAVGYHGFPDIAFAAAFAGEGTFGKHYSGNAVRCKVKDEVLQPCEVGIACLWNTVFPAAIATELFTAPVAVVEGRIGYNVISFEVFMGVVEKGAFVVPFDLGAVDTANSEVNLCQTPSGLVALLTVDRDILYTALMLGNKSFGLHKHTTGTTTGIQNPAFVGFKHCYKQFNNAAWRVELPALLAFGESEFAEEVFEDVTEHVAAP